MRFSSLLCLVYTIAPILGLPHKESLKEREVTAVDYNTRLILFECNNASDCYPPDLNIISTDLISCFQNACLCYPCFTINTMSGKCQVEKCFKWNSDEECVDTRDSQKEVFILSFFLSSLGVANFYIGQWEIGIAQLLLFIFLLFLCCFCCTYFCCLLKFEEDCCNCCQVEESVCPMCTMIMTVVFATIVLISIMTWWLIDLLYFGLNQRDSGNGCTLKMDF